MNQDTASLPTTAVGETAEPASGSAACVARHAPHEPAGSDEADDRVGHLRVEELRCYNRTEEVEEGREGDSEAWRQGSSPNGRRDSVRRVVEAVGEVKRERYGDSEDEKKSLCVKHF